jgi:uncharacterized membrane protein YwaF
MEKSTEGRKNLACGILLAIALPLAIFYYETIFCISTSGTYFAVGTWSRLLFSLAYGGLAFLVISLLKKGNLIRIAMTFALAVLAGIAYFANVVIGPGANYLFMARPESTPSILDILPSNFALRLLIMGLVVTLMFFLSYLPWLIKDVRAKKKVIAEKS